MPRELNINSVRGRMPVRYRVPVLSRVLGIVAHIFISGYCIFVLFSVIRATSPFLMKVLPLLVLFVSLDALFRHFTTLNSVIFTPECLWFRYLLLPSVPIEYEKISSMELRKVITYYMFLEFTDRRGKTRVLKSPASFPKMMEIMYNIADLAPQARLNDELDKMVGVIRRMKEKQSEVEQ
ncbi:MAG: hypothetical protein PHH07_02550 [Candidatus Cloacimonetes bacterium]|nr:hypothetical protein [Candidatus Cloacimonadota bacterium]